MAPGSNNNNNNNNSNMRQTGTVPKTKTSRKNSVPQEIVAPTRRDLQQHLNDLVNWASSSHQEHQQPQLQSNNNQTSKPRNNRTPGEGTCFELDNLSLQDNSRFIPVRPILRRNLLHDDINDQHLSLGHSSHLTNAAIGVVIPTTPNTTIHQNDSTVQILNPIVRNIDNYGTTIPSSPLSLRVPDGAPQSSGTIITQSVSGTNRRHLPTTVNSVSAASAAAASAAAAAAAVLAKSNIEDRLNQIQEYIRVTSTLINSIQNEKSEEFYQLVDILNNLKDSETKLKRLLLFSNRTRNSETIDLATMVNNDDNLSVNADTINSIHLETLATSGSESEINGPRPQSVSSVHSSTPNTPTFEEIQHKINSSNRNMQNMKDQQTQLMRMQQAAKQQLQEMEQIRAQNSMSEQLNQQGPPIYDNVEQVHDDVSSLMNRMRSLTNFIQNQNDLTSFLGDDAADVMAEQVMLQKKLQELKLKKNQMDNLVNELQNMNVQAERNFPDPSQQQAISDEVPGRMVPISLERIVPIEMINSQGNISNGSNINNINNNSMSAISDIESETDNAEPDSMDDAVQASMINNKIAEINQMKDQLKRLKDMMETVKLIEMKAGGPDSEEMAEAAENVARLCAESATKTESESQQLNNLSESRNKPTNSEYDRPQRDEPVLSDRVQALHAMTQDLRAQALTLVSERDRLQNIKDEMQRRRDDLMEKNSNKSSSTIREMSPRPKDLDSVSLKEEYEVKKKEFEKIVEKINEEERQREQQNKKQSEQLYIRPAPVPHTTDHHNLWTTQSQHSHATAIHNDSEASNLPSIGKESIDSGAADVLGGLSLDAASFQSESSRCLSMPPPMQHMNERSNIPPWRKATRDSVEISPGNPQQQPSGSHELPHNHFSPCNSFYGPSQPYYQPGHPNGGYNIDHQSPHCHHHHMGNEHFYTNPCGNRVSTSDSLLLQQFIQTQQMLVNSVSQCNQLLWSQQRELNNLNNAVLLLQERILKQEVRIEPGIQSLRAESVPPTPTANSQMQSYLQRAQSEQPITVNCTQSPYYPNLSNQQTQYPQPLSPVRTYPSYQNQFFRNQNSNNNVNNRVARVTGNIQPQQQQQQPTSNYFQAANEMANNLQQTPQQIFSNNMLNMNPFNNTNNLNQLPVIHPTAGPQQSGQTSTILNNNPNSLLNSQQCQPQSPPIFIHHNNNTSNNNTNLQHQNLPTTSTNVVTANNAFSSSVPPALNNQVPPGNRANNYWDNFRSYSRQNLLSGNSCKSNEDSCSSTSSNFPCNIDRSFQRNQQQPNFMTHNNLPMLENKFQHYFRNQFNQLNQLNTPDVLNINQPQHQQQQQQHQQQPQQEQEQHHQQEDIQLSNIEENNDDQPQLTTEVLGFHTNPINLGVSEFSAKSKTLSKGNGNKKRSRQLRALDRNILVAPSVNTVNGNDLNLASAITSRQDSKSTSKLFEALKENVYLEVSALIAANESRPHFLIQLFRDLQLMSSDPLRHRTLQSIQDLYNRYVESTIQEEVLIHGGVQDDSSVENLQTRSMNNGRSNGAERYDFPSSSQSTPARSIANSSAPPSSDYDFIRIVTQEIADFLQTIDHINDGAIQRISTIALTHLNNSINEKLTLNKYFINQDDFVRHLNSSNRNNKDEFLSSLENYLNNVFLTNNEDVEGASAIPISATTPPSGIVSMSSSMENQTQQASIENYLPIVPQRNNGNFTIKLSSSSDDGRTSSSKYSEANGLENDIITIFGHVPCNGDLAEADQVCSNESLYSHEEDIRSSGDGATVGNNAAIIQHQQHLPPGSINNSQEEDGVWVTDEEVEILSNNGGISNSSGTGGSNSELQQMCNKEIEPKLK